MDVNFENLIQNVISIKDMLSNIGDMISESNDLKIITIPTKQGPKEVIPLLKKIFYPFLKMTVFDGRIECPEEFNKLFFGSTISVMEDTIKKLEQHQKILGSLQGPNKQQDNDKTKKLLEELELIKERNEKLIFEIDTLKQSKDFFEKEYREQEKTRDKLKEKIAKSEEKYSNLLNLITLGPLYLEYCGKQPRTLEEKEMALQKMIKDIEYFLHEQARFNINDYVRVIGVDFEPICGLLYRLCKTRGNIDGVRAGLQEYIHRRSDANLNDIIEEYFYQKEQVDQFLDILKTKIKERGVYCRKVGETTEYYGVTSQLYEEKERYMNLCNELQRKIDVLLKKLEKLRKPVTQDLLGKIKDQSNEDTTLIHNLFSYCKKKLFRRKGVAELFPEIKYTPGMRYAGITISKWHYDYLSNKSLVRILSKKPEEITTMPEMKYSIKCLSKLCKIMDARKALLWVRNLFARKLGRDTAGLKQTQQETQDKRFYNTYIFDECSLEDFLNDPDKVTKYMKQYKQLDREINAHYLSRYYNKQTMRSWENNQKKKLDLTFVAHYYHQEIGQIIDRETIKPTKSNRNPLVAYRKLAALVDSKYKHTHTDAQRIEILNDFSILIPQITYGSNEPPQKYIKYCTNVIRRHTQRPGPNDIAVTSYKTFLDEINKNKKDDEDEIDSSSYDSPSYETDYSYDDDY